MKWTLLQATGLALAMASFAPVTADEPRKPVRVIFDTDIGNDCDDVQAIAMLHALQSRGECELIAVTITKDHELAAPFTDCLNTFYGRGGIPIGVCRSGITPEPGKFNVLAQAETDGQPRYPHDLKSGKDAPDAVKVLRKALAQSEDNSVVICQVGFSTNLADLLKSPADDVSPLNGAQLAKQKVRLLSIMAGAFELIPNEKTGEFHRHAEYNVIKDIPAAQTLAASWPSPIVWSGFEIGLNLKYPHQSILRDYGYVKHHPVAEAYIHYIPPPHDRPTWDLTSVLYAVRPDHGYFRLSAPGKVTVDEKGFTEFIPAENGRDRYLINIPQGKSRVIEALTLLSSEPPHANPAASPSAKK